MIDLPRDLAPWGPLLGLFPDDLAAALAAWLPRLALAVGPMRTSRPTGDGDPDGFTGLARRGSYERLLLTEWLLADELPDEFLRRAAGGEHAFLQLARRTPARARTSVALFDAGPDQLGAPRLAHLAALIVLAARAERAGARFAWGLLHRPDGPLFTEVTQQSVQSLLAARTGLPSSDDDARAWSDRAHASGWEDAWIVGAAAVPGWKFGTLAVHDVLDPDRRALALVARAPGAPPRESELDLPPDRAAARLLRDPFAVAAPAPSPRRHGIVPASNLVFAANGTKLFARAAFGEIASFPVPNSPNAPAGRPKRYRPRADGVVAAVGWVARTLVMLTIAGDKILLEHTSNDAPVPLQNLFRHEIRIPEGLAIAAPQPADPLAPLFHTSADGGDVYFTDARRALYRVWRERPHAGGEGAAHVERIAQEVAALASAGDRVVFLGRGLGMTIDDPDLIIPLNQLAATQGGWHLVSRGVPGPSTFDVPLAGDGTFEASFGAIPRSSLPRELVAVQQRGDRWSVLEDAASIADLGPPADARVIGPWRAQRDAAVQLLLLEPDGRTITLLGPDGPRPLTRAAAPITDAVLSTAGPLLAYATLTGEVVLHALDHDRALARFLPEAL